MRSSKTVSSALYLVIWSVALLLWVSIRPVDSSIFSMRLTASPAKPPEATL